MFAVLVRKSTDIFRMVGRHPLRPGVILCDLERFIYVLFGLFISLDCLVKDRSCFTMLALMTMGFRLPPPPTVDLNIPFKRVNLFQGTRSRGGSDAACNGGENDCDSKELHSEYVRRELLWTLG